MKTIFAAGVSALIAIGASTSPAKANIWDIISAIGSHQSPMGPRNAPMIPNVATSTPGGYYNGNGSGYYTGNYNPYNYPAPTRYYRRH